MGVELRKWEKNMGLGGMTREEKNHPTGWLKFVFFVGVSVECFIV